MHWAAGLSELPNEALADALVVAWELLDVVPLSVLELDESGSASVVLVDPRTGRERLGGPGRLQDRLWIDQWWPWTAWKRATASRSAGTVTFLAQTRSASLFSRGQGGPLRGLRPHPADRPALGSLTGFRGGRAVPPRPDGSMDITAHVAIDSVAAGGSVAELTTQARALAALGVSDPELLDRAA